MRVAVLSDIHGNLPALEAVLADVELEDAAAIVVAGDCVSGPWPAEVFDRLEAVGALIVRGNADRLDEVRDVDSRQAAWTEAHLGADRLATVADWPLTLEVEVDGLGTALVCHATPVSDEPIYTRLTPEEELIAVLGPVAADVLVCGHTHMQYDRQLSSGLRVVNPGSVGMPYEGRRGAYWALLGPEVEFRRSGYDVERAISAIRELGAPVEGQQLELLANPPAPEVAAAEFEKLRAP
jgi:putative phosphoesterase